MKKILIGCLTMLCAGLSTHIFAATITGRIANAAGKKVYLSEAIYSTDNEMVHVDSATLADNGTFTLTHKLTETGLYDLTCGNNSMKLFLQPDAAFDVVCDIKAWPQSITFSGKKGAAENTIYLKMRLAYFNGNIMGNIMNYNATTYPVFADSLHQAMYATYNAELKHSKVNPEFDAFIHNEIDYSTFGMRLAFNIVKSYYSSGKASYNCDIPTYYDFLKDIDLNNDTKALSDAYVNFMNNYTHYSLTTAHETNPGAPAFDAGSQLDWVRQHYTGKVRDYLMSFALKQKLDGGDLTNMATQLEDYKNNYNINPAYSQRIQKEYDRLTAFAAGKEFPDFSLPDSTGKMHSIKELRGKVVYIDYWASWCGPCRGEMPYSRQVMAKYKGRNDVAFVFISIDSKKDAWLNAMQKEQLNGLHLNASGGWGDAICRKYQINSIPRYMLIDKNGRIVSMSAKRPSDGIDQDIDKLLK